jgi:hypothetical protein
VAFSSTGVCDLLFYLETVEMSHPHRINTCTNAELAKGAILGLLQGWLSVAIPMAVAWYFFGHLLPEPEPAVQKPIIEARIDV